MSNRIIWQAKNLYQPGYGFDILLNPEFAKEMFDSELYQKNHKRMQELSKEFINTSITDPYIFHKETCLIKQINIPGDGIWLSLENQIPNFNKPLEYSTHNTNYRYSPSDALTLMKLFDLWVEYSKELKDKI